jgi:hypothetical protein
LESSLDLGLITFVLGIIMLDSSLDLSSITSVLGPSLCWYSCALCFSVCSKSIEMCRSQRVRFSSTVLLERAFMSAAGLGEMLACGSDSVLVVDPFAKF